MFNFGSTLLGQIVQHPILLFTVFFPLLYSIIAHEIAHGAVALLFGDQTAKRNQRLTLNPIPHIDPIGMFLLLIANFGWAKPVPVDYRSFSHSRLAIIAVSLAGCFVNILIASVAYALLQFPSIASVPLLFDSLRQIAFINIILGAFNLIPIPPLDGSKVLMAFLPLETQIALSRIEPYGFFILIALLVTGILDPVIRFMQIMILGLIQLIFHLFG